MRILETEEEYNIVTGAIIGAAIEVHKVLGPGLLESVYEYCLVKELRERDLHVQQQVCLPVFYKGESVGKEFFIDLLVENEVIVELKAIETLTGLHGAQIQTYLRLANKRIGLLINFNVKRITPDGLRRIVNDFF